METSQRPTLRKTSALASATVRWGAATLLAAAASVAMAQPAPPAPPAAGASAPTADHGPHHGGPRAERGDRRDHDRMHKPDPARMQAFVAKSLQEQKERLKITPNQEAAWSTYAAAMQPPAQGPGFARLDRAGMDKLSTPERIDRMRAMRAQRDAEMDKRGDAIKGFYAALSPEQQKTFDTDARRFFDRHGPGHDGPRGPHGRPGEPRGAAPQPPKG